MTSQTGRCHSKRPKRNWDWCDRECRYAKGVNSEHFNTSAKTGIGVADIFSNLAGSNYYPSSDDSIEIIE